MTLHGCTNGVGALYKPDIDWQGYPGFGTTFQNMSYMVRDIFNPGNGQFVTKMFMGSDYATFYPHDTFSGPTNLKELAQLAPFALVFGDPNFNVFVLDCFTWNDGGGDKWKFSNLMKDTPNYFDDEYAEIHQLVYHLLTAYANKTFVITDQEGDWSLISSTDLNDTKTIHWDRIDNMVCWHQTRQRAVRDAVAAATASSCTAMYAPEVNRVIDCLNNPQIRRVSTKVLQRISPDMVAYSAYDSLFGLQPGESPWHTDQAAMLVRTMQRFADATSFLQDASGVRAFWSEWGIPVDDVPTGYDEAAIATAVFNKAEELDVWASLYWQVVDNEGNGYELWDGDGNKKRNSIALAFKELIS